MSEATHAPAHFHGYPYLAVWLTDDCCHLACLPRADEATLLEWTRREHAATGLAVQLVLSARRSVLVDAFGECQRAGFPPCRFPLYDHLSPASALPWDDECAERGVRLAEHCWARTPEGWLAELGPSEARRLVAALASARERQWRFDLQLACSVCGAAVRGHEAHRVRPDGDDGFVVACRSCHERALVASARADLATRLSPDEIAESARRLAFALRRQRPAFEGIVRPLAGG